MTSTKPLLELDLRPVEAPACASPGACVFVLLPPLDQLLGCSGFGDADAIRLPGSRRPVALHKLFAAWRGRLRIH